MTLVGRYRAVHRPQFALAAVDVLGQALAARGPLATPTCPIACLIVEQLTPVARAFDPPLALELRQSPNGTLVIDGRYRIGDGPVRDLLLPDGLYDAELRGDHYIPESFALTWPPVALRTPLGAGGLPVDVTLLPSSAYPYPDLSTLPFNLGPTLLRGSVFTSDGEPVVNAVVRVIGLPPLTPALPAWPFVETRSGERGDWAVLLPDRRRIGFPGETTPQPPVPMTIRIEHPNAGPVVDILGVPVTLGRDNAVPNTALRGTVARSGGHPLDGVAITTSVNGLVSRARADGSWTLYFDPNQPDVANLAVTATAPDGSTVTLNGVAIRNRATVVVPTLHLP